MSGLVPMCAPGKAGKAGAHQECPQGTSFPASSPVLRWSCLAGSGVARWAGAPGGSLQELSIEQGLLVIFSSNPGLLLLPFMAILCMQLNDAFEADNKSASPFLWCMYKSVNTIPLNFISQSMLYGPGEKQQVPGSKRPRPASKGGENISFILSEPGICAQLCLSLLSCCALACLSPLGQTSPSGRSEDHKTAQRATIRGVRQLPSRDGSLLISLGCRAGTLFIKLGVGRRIKACSHVE